MVVPGSLLRDPHLFACSREEHSPENISVTHLTEPGPGYNNLPQQKGSIPSTSTITYLMQECLDRVVFPT